LNNFGLINSIQKLHDENDVKEKSIEKENIILGSDIKNFKQFIKVNNKDKHNLLKIVNMYMKDDKKTQSKAKISKLIQNSKINKKSKGKYLNLILYNKVKTKVFLNGTL